MFFQTLFTTLLKFIILAAVAVTGILAGKKIRDHKDAKANAEKDA